MALLVLSAGGNVLDMCDAMAPVIGGPAPALRGAGGGGADNGAGAGGAILLAGGAPLGTDAEVEVRLSVTACNT
jgi:hypothetical protein